MNYGRTVAMIIRYHGAVITTVLAQEETSTDLELYEDINNYTYKGYVYIKELGIFVEVNDH